MALVELLQGNSSEVLFPIKEVLQIVLSVNGCGFIDMHNHLSIKRKRMSKLQPSEADMDSFVDTQEAAPDPGNHAPGFCDYQ